MNRLSKEKKQHEDVNRKLTEDLQAEEDKINHVNKIKAKLEQSIDALEGEIENEKRARQVQCFGIFFKYVFFKGFGKKQTQTRRRVQGGQRNDRRIEPAQAGHGVEDEREGHGNVLTATAAGG
jgi:hypothetical protein